MLSNSISKKCKHLHESNANISYNIFVEEAHPLIASRAGEVAGLIKTFLRS